MIELFPKPRPVVSAAAALAGWAFVADSAPDPRSLPADAADTVLVYGAVALALAAWAASLSEALRRPAPARRRWWIAVAGLVGALGLLALDAVPGLPTAGAARPAAGVALAGTAVVPLLGWRGLALIGLLPFNPGGLYFGFVVALVGAFALPARLRDAARELVPPRIRDARGWTVAEAVAALALISLALTAASGILVRARAGEERIAEAVLRTRVAEAYVEEARARARTPGSPVRVRAGEPVDPARAGGRAGWTADVEVRPIADGLASVVVRIHGERGSSELRTRIAEAAP